MSPGTDGDVSRGVLDPRFLFRPEHDDKRLAFSISKKEATHSPLPTLPNLL